MKSLVPKSISGQTVAVPGSKSISHRMMICSSLCNGTSRVANVLDSEDLSLTRKTLTLMGAGIRDLADSSAGQLTEVAGFGGHPVPCEEAIFLGNSGTSMRLLAGIAALGSTPYTLTGDTRMCQRPMNELLDALVQFGIRAVSEQGRGTPPVTITGGDRTGGSCRLDCSRSSQYLSALLMAGAFMEKGLKIELTGPPVSVPYIDLTLDVMKQFNVTADRISETVYEVPGNQTYTPGDFQVEPDMSNAGYFWAAGAVTGQRIGVAHIHDHSLQGDKKQVDILARMGCQVEEAGGVVSVAGGKLTAVDVDMSDTPDAVPAIAVTAAFAEGTTRIRNIGHLRVKECDRIDAVCSQLEKMGVRTRQGEDFMEITGGTPQGAVIETFNDHRIAMAFAVAGLVVPGMKIENPGCVEKSFPTFWRLYDAL